MTNDYGRYGSDHRCLEESSSELRYGILDCDMAGVQWSATAFASTLNQGVDLIEEEIVNEEESRD